MDLRSALLRLMLTAPVGLACNAAQALPPPLIAEGSNLTTLVLPSGATRFYDADRLLGRIEDPAFGPAFLRIWLDARVAGTALGGLGADLLNRR